MTTDIKITKNQIKAVLKQVVPNEDAEKIIFYLQGKTNISEFIISEELDLEIHRTRNLLYKLLEVNLVSFKRKKDKIKGWYICYWDFNQNVINHLEEKLRIETINKLKTRLTKEESGFFYMCKYAHIRQSFEEAFEENFKCPECGEIMNQVDNERTKEFLKKRIDDLEIKQKEFEKEKGKQLSKLKEEARRLREIEAKEKAEKEREKIERAEKKLTRQKIAEEKRKLKEINEKEKNERKTKEKKKKATVKKLTKKTTKKKTTKFNSQKTNKKTTKKGTIKKPSKTIMKEKNTKKRTTKKKVLTKKNTSKKTTKKKTFAKKIGGLFRK